MHTAPAKYEIDYDLSSRTLKITTHGFWSGGLAAKFAAELIAKGTAIRLRHGTFYTLIDMRNAPIQPASVIESLAGMMPKALMVTKYPIAAVAASSLGKLQTERYLTAPNCRTFLDYDEANIWMRSTPLA